MARLISIILLLLLASPAWAFPPLIAGKSAGGVAGGSEWWGYATEGGSSQTATKDYCVCSPLGTPTTTGAVSKIAIYSSNSSATLDLKFSLYTDNAGTPNALVAAEQAFTNVGTWTLDWKEFTLGTPINVTGSTAYWICWDISESTVLTVYYSTSTAAEHYQVKPYSTAWSDPYVSGGTENKKFSLKAYNSW